jgi:ABC-2 type transport system ATP-binding protein
MSNTVLQVRDLSKSYVSKRSTVEAVKGVSLAIRRQEIFGFLGPNGAGKTTTLRILATLLRPDRGEALIAGYDLLRQPARVRTRIGYVSQAGGSDRMATGVENLVMQAQLYGLRKAEAVRRSGELIEAFSLQEIAGRKVETYSGGQRRRLDVALGMVHTPQLLFLDEPTTGLDPQNRVRMWKEIRRLRDEGVSIFLTTHYMDEADILSDRIAIMDEGRIVAEGTPQQLKSRISGDRIVLGLQADQTEEALSLLRRQDYVLEADRGREDIHLFVRGGETVLPAMLRLLDAAGIGLKTISLNQPTLDDVFLKETGHALHED